MNTKSVSKESSDSLADISFNININVNVAQLRSFLGTTYEPVDWGTFENPINLDIFSTIQYDGNDSNVPSIKSNQVINWNLTYDSSNSFADEEIQVVFRLLNRTGARNRIVSFRDDWSGIVDLENTSGQVSADGNLHMSLSNGDGSFSITAADSMTSPYNLTYTILITFSNLIIGSKVYGKIDPIIRNRANPDDDD